MTTVPGEVQYARSERVDRWVRRHPIAALAFLMACAAAAIGVIVGYLPDRWSAAGHPGLLFFAGVALGLAVLLVDTVDRADPHPAGEFLRPLATLAGLAAAAVAIGAPMKDIGVDPGLYVLAAGYAIAQLLVLIPILVVGTRLRMRHGDRAEEVSEAALRSWFGRRPR